MKKSIVLTVIMVTLGAILCSCNNNQAEQPATQPPKETISTETTSVETIEEALLTGNITVNGVYYEENENGEVKTNASGTPKDFYKEFTGEFSNITNIVETDSNDTNEIIVFFVANIESDYYKITEPQGIQAFLKKNTDNTLSFVSSNIVEDMPLFILPVFNFEDNYLLEKGYETTFAIPATQYKNDYEYAGFDMEYSDLYGKDTNGVYLVNFTISQETVNSIDIIPGKQNTPFKMTSARVILYLKNGLSISTTCDIYFNANNNNKVACDFWNADFSESFYSWSLEN